MPARCPRRRPGPRRPALAAPTRHRRDVCRCAQDGRCREHLDSRRTGAATGRRFGVGVQISPSILSADFARLAEEVDAISSDADWVHVDVMDNLFVPNLTLGLPVVESLLKHTSLPIDCHLMIEDPDRWAPSYAEAGARNVTFHVEAAHAPVRLARTLRAAGARAGVALKPATPVEPLADL